MSERLDLINTAKQAGIFRVFTQALEAAGLAENLKASGPYTVFAPTDEAFSRMRKSNREDLFKTQNQQSLQAVLRNHIVPGKILSSELKRRDDVKTIKGDALRIESRAGIWVNEGQIVFPDLEASNGVIHGIDAVLMLQTEGAGAS